ncbi:MAG: hypothetical protein JSV91_13985, partial [Phycisphaerales bacterium]
GHRPPEAPELSAPGVPVGRIPGTTEPEAPAPPAGQIPASGVALTDLLGHRPPEAPELSAPAGRWLRLLLLLAALLALACGVVLVCAHINDRYQVNMAAGVWTALAQAADDGVLYPPLYDEATGSYGGTRYMPLTILLHTGAAQLTGEYLMSGKIVACASAALMLAAVLAVLLARGCPPLLSLGLVGLIVVSPTGLQSITSIRGDALPVLLQLLALALAARRVSGALPTVVFIGVLCGLAVLAKISAGWAAMAIGLWLLVKDRKALLFFACGFAGLIIVGGFILWLMTDGRFFSSALSLTFAGSENLGAIVMLAPQRLIEFATQWAPICWVLVPLAGAGLVLRLAGRRFTAYHLGFLGCLIILLVIYADWGVGENHVLDLLVLSTILVGDLAGQMPLRKRGMTIPQAALVMVVIVCTPLALLHKPLGPDQRFSTPGRDVVNAIRMLAGGEIDAGLAAAYDPQPLAGLIADDETILSEDPYVPVSLGRKPVLLDGFMLTRMDEPAIDALVGRIGNREFGKIILLREMDVDSWWYSELFFGEAVSAAIAEHYVLDGALTARVHGYYVYVPSIAPPPIDNP